MLQERIDPVVKGYELREQIGEGGYGVVHRAYQPLVGRDVAVKIILPQYANHPDFIRRFEWEAQLVARLEHPYIVPLYDYWRDPDGAFLVMRWLRGGNLHDLLHNRPLPTELLGRLIEQVGSALALAHRRGVVHRDLKPANILLDEEGNAYLADFGIAKDMGTRVSPYQTDATTVVGSPAYISPEQVRAEPITPQTDIYSLGVMLYEILTGQLPFHAPTPIALMFMHMNEPVPTVRTQRPDLSDAVNLVIQKATAKRPSDRYADVSTLIHELRLALASGPAVTARLADPRPTPSPTDSGNRTTDGGRGRSTYETGVLYLPVPLATPIETEIENPYKGLRAFQEADASDFFGRELLTEQLLARMREQLPLGRFLAVVGPSGSGKSSVVRAGLVPAIRRGGLPGSQNWFVVEMFPSAHPIQELAQALIGIAVEPPNNLVGPLTLDDHGLLRVVDQVVPGADETEVVLVIDQFEEVFTLVEDEAERTHFLNSLITAVTDPYSRIRVIVTLRADFYDRPLLYPGFSELMRQRTEVVVPLAPEELKQAIISPAARNGLRVDPELVEAIVSDVAEQPGALPLLQYALTEVFERRNGRTLTLTPYNASGGVLGALARRAEEIYTGLHPAQQEAARQLFLRLVTLGEGVEDTRRRVRRTELATMTTDDRRPTTDDRHPTIDGRNPTLELDHVIATYSQYRLLTLDNDQATRVPTVEVAHEALIRTWTRLRQWLDASRDDLRLQRRMATAAAEWVASAHDRSFLASGARLEQLAAWADETHLALNAEERDYLSASLSERAVQQAQEESRKVHEATLERRSRTFLQALVGVALVAALVGIGLSVYAFGQRREAQRNFTNAATAEAQAKQNAAQSDQNAAQAELNFNTAATAQAQAVGNAALAHDRALLAGASAEYYQDNLDTARTLARLAAEQPFPLPDAENTFSQIAYSPGTRKVFSAPGAVTAAAISPDGTMAVSGSDDEANSIILWDLATGAELGRFEGGHTAALKQIVFLPDGKRMLTASEDHTVVLWDVAGRAIIRTFKAHTNEVRGMALRPNHNQFLSGDGDVNLLLWDIDCVTPSPTECTQPIKRFDQSKGGQAQELNHLTFTSDGARALTTSAEGSLVLWDVDAGTVIKHLEPTENRLELRSVAVLPGDRFALVGGASNDLTLWDLDSGTIARTFKGHKGTVYDVTVSPNGEFALSGSNDNTMMLWDLQDRTAIQRPLRAFYGHGDYIRKIVFSSDGQHALTGSKDKSMRYWDLTSGTEQARWASPQPIKSGALSPDGRYVLTGVDLDALLWKRETGQIVKHFLGHSQAVKATAFSHNGKYVLTGGDKRDGAIILTDLASGQIVRTFSFETFGINTLAFSPDDKYAISGQIAPTDPDYQARPSLNPELKKIGMILWDVETGSVISTFPELKGNVNALAFTVEGTQVVAAIGGDITVWAIPSGDPITTFKGDKSKINSMSVSADGKLALTGGQAKNVRLWDLTTGKQTFASDVLASEITAVALSPDGRYGAAVAESRFYIYDLQAKQLIRTFAGHSKAVRFLSFSADGRSLVSGGEDNTVRTWRLDTRPEMLAWAEANRYFPNLTCDQETYYRLEPAHCSADQQPAAPKP